MIRYHFFIYRRGLHVKSAMPFLFSLLIGLSMTACSDYFDQIPDDRITIEEVFKKKKASEEYLANIYSYIPDESQQVSGQPWGGTNDEMDITWTKYPSYDFNIGNISATAVLFDFWGPYYKGIRAATYFINHIDENEEIRSLNGQVLIDQYKAEARFLRAYYYFLLFRQFGPFVIIGDAELPADATAADMQLPRSTIDACADYVVSELDQAAAVLPLRPERNGQVSDAEYGRATKGMCYAVKSRLLLYAASPLYNGNKTMANFKNSDGTPFINQQVNVEKWKRAADASKELIDLGIYQLYKDPSGDPLKSIQGTFFQAWNSEQIFVRKSNDLANWDVNSMPRQAGGWCGIGPTQEMVDAYFMEDGKSITESDLYNETGFTTVDGNEVFNMYLHREPRFYASVTYHNSIFQGGNMSKAEPISFYYSGPNGRRGHATDWSRTGYLIRKNVGTQTNIGSGGNGQRQNRPLALFRLAEIYLNYAEALNEYNPGDPAILKYLNLVRERAGIPQYGNGANALPVPPGQGEMREKIHQERRVELAFESHRWFDIRRWMIVSQVMGTLHGMDINQDGESFFKRVVATNHIFRSSYYWFPISQYEMDRSHLLVQNPGW